MNVLEKKLEAGTVMRAFLLKYIGGVNKINALVGLACTEPRV